MKQKFVHLPEVKGIFHVRTGSVVRGIHPFIGFSWRYFLPGCCFPKSSTVCLH